MDADRRDERLRQLEADSAALREENARLKATIEELLKRITQLEARHRAWRPG